MSLPAFQVGISLLPASGRRMNPLRRAHKARFQPAPLTVDHGMGNSASSSTLSTSASSSSSSSSQLAEPGDVFGPSHPLYPLVSVHLPDVLTRLVIAYHSPLLPRQQHYRGHVLMPDGTWAFRDQRDARTSANALSLDRHSFSWSGWMNRSPARRHGRNYFLLSFRSHSKPGSSHLHVGYRKHYVEGRSEAQNRAFTFGFNGNDLDVRPHHANLDLYGCWEHWSGSFEYPRPQTEPPTPIIPHTNETFSCSESTHPPAGTVLGRRKLYRNGVLLVEDDCIPLVADADSTLVLGNYENHGMDMTLDGGVCDVRVYSRALNEAEIRALYEGDDQGVSAEGLEAHYPLEGDKHIPRWRGAPQRFVDVSGHERHLEHRRNFEWREKLPEARGRFDPNGEL